MNPAAAGGGQDGGGNTVLESAHASGGCISAATANRGAYTVHPHEDTATAADAAAAPMSMPACYAPMLASLVISLQKTPLPLGVTCGVDATLQVLALQALTEMMLLSNRTAANYVHVVEAVLSSCYQASVGTCETALGAAPPVSLGMAAVAAAAALISANPNRHGHLITLIQRLLEGSIPSNHNAAAAADSPMISHHPTFDRPSASSSKTGPVRNAASQAAAPVSAARQTGGEPPSQDGETREARGEAGARLCEGAAADGRGAAGLLATAAAHHASITLQVCADPALVAIGKV